jgi:ubiquinone/menaquinone biosynthesis C-methylase UbiE
MRGSKNRVCPVELAGGLDNRFRRWLQNPRKILGPHIQAGMVAMDLGCGPGFFTLDLAQLVGPAGQVIAADLQEGMLQKLKDKIRGTELESRIVLHRCGEKAIGWPKPVDFILAFYMVHELPDPDAFFREVGSMLKPGGQVLIVEPPFHVSNADFEHMLRSARDSGLRPAQPPKVFLSRAVLLKKDV